MIQDNSYMRLGNQVIRTGTADITPWLHKETGKVVYVKKFFNAVDYAKEKEANNMVNNFNVIHSISAIDSEQALVIEDGGEDLLDYINRTYREGLYESEEVILKKFKNLFYSLDNMHDENIVHGDIKADNISTSNDIYSFFDFGQSEKLKNNEKSYKTIGTKLYLAPEVINKKGHDTKADVYALGVTLYIALTKNYPFDTTTEEIYEYQQMKGNFNADELFDFGYSYELINLISLMLEPNPDKRCTIKDCIRILYSE